MCHRWLLFLLFQPSVSMVGLCWLIYCNKLRWVSKKTLRNAAVLHPIHSHLENNVPSPQSLEILKWKSKIHRWIFFEHVNNQMSSSTVKISRNMFLQMNHLCHRSHRSFSRFLHRIFHHPSPVQGIPRDHHLTLGTVGDRWHLRKICDCCAAGTKPWDNSEPDGPRAPQDGSVGGFFCLMGPCFCVRYIMIYL